MIKIYYSFIPAREKRFWGPVRKTAKIIDSTIDNESLSLSLSLALYLSIYLSIYLMEIAEFRKASRNISGKYIL